MFGSKVGSFHIWMHDWCFRPRLCTARLNWAGDNLGEWDEFRYEPCWPYLCASTIIWYYDWRSRQTIMSKTQGTMLFSASIVFFYGIRSITLPYMCGIKDWFPEHFLGELNYPSVKTFAILSPNAICELSQNVKCQKGTDKVKWHIHIVSKWQKRIRITIEFLDGGSKWCNDATDCWKIFIREVLNIRYVEQTVAKIF